jgi:C1A family cysteine protease
MTTTAAEDERAISPRSAPALVAALLGAAAILGVVALVWPAGVSAAGQARVPQAGLLDPAFVEALHRPLAGVFGKLPNPVEVQMDGARPARLRAAALPPAYDLRSLRRLTPVRDQGGWGTCWAFANLAAVESRLLPGKQWDFSEDNLVTRSGYGPFAGGRYVWGGWDYMAVAYLTRWAGPVNESSDRYHTPKPPKNNVTRKHVQGVVMLPGRHEFLDNDLIKQMVVQNGALSVGMFWARDFYSRGFVATSATSIATYYCDVAAGEEFNGYEISENHGVAIVGWDDTLPATLFSGSSAGTPPGDGAFLARNSWGAGWGDRGYFWVSYYDRSFAFDDCTSYSRVEPVSDYSRNYQYDTLGWTKSLGYPDVPDPSVAWAANRFTAKGDERIVAEGFYAPAAGTGYQVWAGASLDSLTLRGTGTVTLPGFATIDLTTPLSVRSGQKFVVAVRLDTPGDAQPIAVEAPAETWEKGAAAKAGQSFMRYGDGDPWLDFADDPSTADANVCLKAYAGK